MRRFALFALLAAAATANAALPRVAVDAPLAPVSAPSVSAAPSISAPAFFPPPAATSIAPAPFLFSPALAAPSPLAVSALPAALRAPADVEPAGLKTIEALNANASPAEKISPADASDEDAAQKLEARFDGTRLRANDGDSIPVLPPLDGEAAPPADPARDPLLARLLKTVRLDDGGVPERHAALTKALQRMLQTPTARALAERFIEDGAPAVVRFEEFEGSRIFEVNGRKIFHAPRAFSGWDGKTVEVRLNLDYLGTNPEYLEQDLPPTIAHELFGHGLWYSRAERANLVQAVYHHELNETNARLVGWLVDFELDERFEEGAAWTYMQNPAAFQSSLKLRLAYYALTWSTAELARPKETLVERSLAAQAKRDQLRVTLSNHLSWNGVLEHFASGHKVAETRLRALRAYMAEEAKRYEAEIALMNALITEVDATVGRMNAEPGRESERYLQWAATHPIFADLRAETDEHTRRLLERVSKTSAKLGDESEDAKKAREDHWRGQITFEQLVEMYNRDREQHPAHWRG